MPTTLHGLVYPAPFDVPDVPADLQRLAEQLDAFIAVYVRPTAADTHNTSTPHIDPQMQIVLPAAGVYSVECTTGYSCPNAAVDVAQTWDATGVTLQSRFAAGPETATANTASTLMVNRPIASFTSSQGFGIFSSGTTYVREELMVSTTGSGTLKLRYAQNTNTAGVDVTRSALSHLIIQKILAA
jgi:hypothetical protein